MPRLGQNQKVPQTRLGSSRFIDRQTWKFNSGQESAAAAPRIDADHISSDVDITRIHWSVNA